SMRISWRYLGLRCDGSNDKTAYGKGTFKTFGIDDEKGFLHKYSIKDSIKDGTTLELFYSLAPNEMLVPKEQLEQEFLSLAESEGVSDIEELNKILEKAVNLCNFLKGRDRVDKIACYVADHYKKNVEPLGYKAFLVGVDREACTLYKNALDKYLPPEYSAVVYSGNHNDTAELKRFHLSDDKEKEIRKVFAKQDTLPRILIVTEKLLTGYDAPVLYAMYLDKPMRDHALLQAIARVNRPYENEEKNMKKPHGFVLDFIGIFDKLEKALAFDSDEIDSVIKDINILKAIFSKRMTEQGKGFMKLVSSPLSDKDVDVLIDHFSDPSKRKEFFKFYKEVESLYEIISPDVFLRSFIDDYGLLSEMYLIVRNAFAKRVVIDKEFLRKTNDLVQEHIGVTGLSGGLELFEINEDGVQKIKDKHAKDHVKIINLIKVIQKEAEEQSDDLFLQSMAIKAETIQQRYEDKQETTKELLDELYRLLEEEIRRKNEQKDKGLDGLTYFIFGALKEKGFKQPEETAKIIKEKFNQFPHWASSDQDYRELRTELYYVLGRIEDNIDKCYEFVDYLFSLLERAQEI
ncbi:MAG: type I restriction endonuclease subunit R, partial [Candidatus Margulisiibacteriota bacterium]